MSLTSAVRLGLVAFVLAWILGPSELRATVPLLVVFLVALGLELGWLAGALRGGQRTAPDRRPQEVDRLRYGFPEEGEEPGDELEPAPPPRRSPLVSFAVGLGLIAALLGAVWLVESRTGWDALEREVRVAASARFSEEASRIAGKPVTIHCDEGRDFVGAVQDADGVAVVGGDLAYLTPEICLELHRLAFEGESRGARTARAIAVLAHEAWHLRGVRDEGETECYALQSGVEVGRRLGLSDEEAQRMMRQQLTENALRRGGGIEYRIPAECRDGGRLDLRPGDSRFP